ncbi:hypothetical protein K2173_020088 [Erythroxylum novogranatense]|uniref:Uncharacterized protein n=1 Tax=Erythroxylum novogranatense TaxID=1862640 RepID=A0AAV8UAA6_9ROSI|nr:hypothetical protein K2173_020088 [Erythroxylum novogranatense]
MQPTLKNSATPCQRKELSSPSSHLLNCLAILKSGCDFIFTRSRDGTLKRWTLDIDSATCSATFESHVDWVNDAVLAGDNTLVSCFRHFPQDVELLIRWSLYQDTTSAF